MNAKHKKVQIVVLQKDKNKLNLLLLQTKPDRGEFWQNVTGSAEGDENFEQAAMRELEEETGFKSEVHLLPLSYNFHDRWKRDVEEKCFYTIVEQTNVRLCEEHQDYKWIPVKDVQKSDYIHHSNFESFLKAVECINF